ncbi:MAG: hypothetical protein L0H63_09070 [Nitrococcus sp.]|nr:hypothetical protein [Nitrococcus sp.]
MGTAPKPELACGAALLGAQAYFHVEDYDAAADLLEEVAGKVPDCPELIISLLSHIELNVSVERRYLRQALIVAPEYADDFLEEAELSDSTSLANVCSELARTGTNSISAKLDAMAESRISLAARLRELGEKVTSRTKAYSLGASKEPPLDLVWAGRQMTAATQDLASLAGQTRTAAQRWITERRETIASERDQIATSNRKRKEWRDGLTHLLGWGLPWLLLLVILLSMVESEGGWDYEPAQVADGKEAIGFLLAGLILLGAIPVFSAIVVGLLSISGSMTAVSPPSCRRVEAEEQRVSDLEVAISGDLSAAERLIGEWPAKRTIPLL